MATEFEGIPGNLDDLSKSGEPGEVSMEKPDEGIASEVIFRIPIETTDDTVRTNQENDRHFQDISEQMNPMSPLKAVPLSGEQETLLSDDDTPKILTTLEPVKKKQENQEQSTEKGNSQSNSQGQEELGRSDPESIARKQLETLNTLNRRKGRPKADDPRPIEILRAHASNKKIQILENKVLPPSAEDIFSGLRNINMRPARSLQSNILTREELTREIIQKCRKSTTSNDKIQMRSPQKRREEVAPTGTIEIPQELILSTEDTAPLIVQETESLEGEDLLAILQGDDEDGQETSVYELRTENSAKTDENVHVEEYTISLVTDPAKKQIDKEEEMEIAMKQILSLPVKPKGRRPKKTPVEDESYSQKSRAVTASDLVSSLVSDWSDNEEKSEEIPVFQQPQSETTVEVVVSTAQPPVTVPLKSSRIIKKKVIWDPDAPETQFSYASKVQGSSSKSTADKIVVKRQQTPKVLVVEEKSSVLPTKSPKRTASAVSVSGAKKRKLTEVDKLLGDEGAVNMIYSLERENNNSNLPEIAVKPDKNQMVSKSKEKNTLVARAKAVRNVVIKQMVDSGQGTPRGRPKREVVATQISPPTPPKKTTPTKKRNTTRESVTSSTASESWDFLYSTPQGDDSMIIRRRSNSSYSGSTTSPRRLSIDQHHEDGGRKSNSFEFAKPVDKKTPKIDPSAAQNLVAELKGKLNQAISRGNVTIRAAEGVNSVAAGKVPSASKITKDTPVKLRASERKLGSVEFKEITIRRYDNFVQLIFSPTFGSLKNVLTIGVRRGHIESAQVTSFTQHLLCSFSCCGKLRQLWVS